MRIIAHVDMDAYYASVEARYNPALRDKPVVVGADPKEGHGRGVVEAASYAARRYGIRSAMPISRAWKLAVVAPEDVQAFLDPMGIRVIPGIGPKTEAELHERGIRTVRDLRALERAQLADWFGRWGEDLHAKARGLSDSPVSNEWEPKSVGEQETFEVNTLDAPFILERVRALAGEVFTRLRRQGFRACRTVTITVRFAHFRTLTRSHTSREEIASEETLYAGAAQLFLPFFDARENPRGTKIRLIGVRAEKLVR